jgi:hypothetical protein
MDLVEEVLFGERVRVEVVDDHQAGTRGVW